MFRTKQAVDRHVQEIFRKVKDENERNLRCYNIAKLYFQVEDYESARRYVSSYLEVNGDQAGPYKLLGKIYEALGQKELALAQYKLSLELEPRQDDLILKVCELLVDTDIGHNVNRVKYWIERADERFPHHPTVFQLKEKLLTADKSTNDGEDLEALIAAELSARPCDVQLRVKLLKYYVDKSRVDDAYKHALDVEATHAHRDSVAWYEALCDLLSKYKDGRQPKWTFWILYVSSLERYAALSLKEQGHAIKKTISEAIQAVFNFDQALTETKLQNFHNNATFAEHMFGHMWGQLNFHLACLLLRRTKREQGTWSETGRLCAPLLLAAMHIPPIDITAAWAANLKDQKKSLIQVWHREASYRCSQAGHILQNYARNNVKRMMEQVDKFCVGLWRERIYQRIFVSKAHIATSYFTNHNAVDPPLRLCSSTELKIYDEVAEEVWPASLHHHVWLGIVDYRRSNDRYGIHDEAGPRPHQYCHVFPALRLSVFNLSQAAPDSLGQLDVDAFLNAAVLCASVIVEEQQRSGFLSPDRLPILPADITNTLCTCTQEKWWSSAYKMYCKPAGITGDLGEIRQELQRGLEVVRCIGNHGLHPAILVHLARIFHHRAKLLQEKDKNHSDLAVLEARCELYWSAVVPLLERLLNNQTIRSTNTKLFDYQGKEMSNVELTNALEEGRLFLAQRYVREKQHEQAIEALQALKCPEASFMQGEIYKSLADELMSTLPKESLTSAMRSQHIVMLSKARGCYYLTLDRLRSPGMNPKHPLNSELGSRIADIENDLKRIDPDVWRANRHECEVMSEESYSSAHSGDQPVIQNSYTGGIGSTFHMLGTPQKSSAHRTPKQASTPCRMQHQDILELTRKSAQQEARPSPERLDAQIRQLIHSKDNMIQTILDQNKSILEANKNLVESNKMISARMEQLEKQFANFCKDLQQSQSRQNRARSVSAGQNNLDDDLYCNLGNEDYAESSCNHLQQQQQQSTVQTAQIPPNLFAQQQRNPYTPLVYPQAAALQGYYPATMPFNDPHVQHISPLYAGPRVFQMPTYYPRPPIDPNLAGLPKMQESMQGLFTSRLMNQLTDLGPQSQPPPTQQPLQPQVPPPQHLQSQLVAPPPMVTPLAAPQLSMQLQNFDTTRHELPAKDIPISQSLPAKEPPASRPAPVNVVITTSDTLPTTAPSVQPQLSVTIPPQYRAATSVNHAIPAAMTMTTTAATNTTTTSISTAPHSYQISMPSHAMIPTTVNLPPLSTTITNTISATVAEQERNQQKTTSLLSTSSSHNYSGEGSEIEHDPLPDFVPVIPLPAEVQVTTGEENEDELFCARAKLYRWSDREWKERGVGSVKLLRNKDGKVRLVMRREQVLKICANHMLTADMELTKMVNNERAWIWVANDFADEEVKLEKLCIKFKYVEEAQTFKENFDKAKASAISSSSKNEAKVEPASAVESSSEKEPESSKNFDGTKSTMLGGFSFSSQPMLKTMPQLQPVKNEEPPKPSPFADFSFTKSTGNNDSSAQPGSFSFVKTPVSSTTTTTISAKGSSSNAGDGSRPGLRRPHAPPPSATKNITEKVADNRTEIRGTIEANGEALFYDNKATLMRCNSETGQWKNRGLGSVKILLDPKTGKPRLLIKRDETGKILCNYNFLESTKFALLSGTDNVINWTIEESSKGKVENLACLFESQEQANQFNDLLASIQRNMKNDRVQLTCLLRQDGKTIQLIDSPKKSVKEKASLAEMFKPPSGSWECGSCYTRNDSGARRCVACQAEQPGSSDKTTETTIVPPGKTDLWDKFKPQPESWECRSCYIRNSKENSYCVACDTAKDPSMPAKQKTSGFNLQETSKEQNSSGFTFGLPKSTGESNTLADMFKPQPGSWECQSCLLRNSETTNYCVACETAKDPSLPPKPKTIATFDTKTTTPSFSFGIPQASTKDSNPTGFTFKMQSHDDKSSEDTKNISIFGGPKSTAPSSNFVFGIPQRPLTPPNKETPSGFAFGSPGKSFDFQFSAKSPTAKSPGDRGGGKADTSEDEVAESDDIYFAPVIPLPDKVAVKTGEEDEEIVYTHRAKLFRYDSAAKEWKERGLGDIKILRHSQTKKLRMVMRRDQTLKLCLNHVVTKDLELKPKDEKTWLWNAADYSEGDIECLQLACRFKTSEIANVFKETLQEALATLENTSEEKESKDSTTTEALEDIEVVYKVTVTEEEKAAALKLRLPENFYAYRAKKDCPGCRGCREPEIPLFGDETSKTSVPPPTVAPKIAPPKFTVPGLFGKSPDSPSTAFGNSESPQKPVTQFGGNEDSKKFPGFVFGSSLSDKTNIFSAPATNSQTGKTPLLTNNFNIENLNICSPNSAANQQQTTNQQPFGKMTSLFGGNNFSGQSSIFSATPNTGISIFSGNAGSKTSVEAPKENDTNLGSSFQNIFGSTKRNTTGGNSIFGSSDPPTSGSLNFGTANSNSSTTGNTIFGGKSATHTFGSLALGSGSIFGGENDGKLSFGNLASTTANETAKETPVGQEKVAEKQEEKKTDPISFLPLDNSATFSALAAQNPTTTSFQKDPNFSFAGAGVSVFGTKKSTSNRANDAVSPGTKKTNEEGEEEGDDENNEDPNNEHDPHFEPIVPLPDAIEVRTGEEEEEKLFAQRAKLYRYEPETKEWKERGTGEMKLLHHSEHGTYRLLLRREQVHKLVCNQLVTLDLDLRPIHSSDRAWMWAAFNHAEEPYALEELAVRFKNPELALQFKEAIDKAKLDIQERQASGQGRVTETDSTECYSEDHKDEIDEEEDDEENTMIFASPVDLFAFQDNAWNSLGAGILKILYDSEIYGAKIIVTADDTGEILSNTVISMETTMERNQNACEWIAIDEVLNPPTRRSLKAVFAVVELAQEMYMNFQDGQEYAKQADISETSYYDSRIE